MALVAPHAGLIYSGPVAAHAYRLVRNRRFDVAILVGPSHFTAFDGVGVVSDGGFETPLGVVAIDAACVADLRRATSAVRSGAGVASQGTGVGRTIPGTAAPLNGECTGQASFGSVPGRNHSMTRTVDGQ